MATDSVIFLSKVATKLAELFGDLHQMYELPFETKDAVFSKEKEEIMRDNYSETKVFPYGIQLPSEPADKAIPSFTPILEPMKASTESNFMLVSSSYAFFFADQRELLRQQYPQLSLNELNKISLKCWKELSNSQRAKYNDLFTKMKQYYQYYFQQRLHHKH